MIASLTSHPLETKGNILLTLYIERVEIEFDSTCSISGHNELKLFVLGWYHVFRIYEFMTWSDMHVAGDTQSESSVYLFKIRFFACIPSCEKLTITTIILSC